MTDMKNSSNRKKNSGQRCSLAPGVNTMQAECVWLLPVCVLCEGTGPSLEPSDGCQNFAEMLPAEMSERIFGELDAGSLCSASQTCRLWHGIIEQSQLWRQQCLLVRAVCQREVDRDRRDGLSWKVKLLLALLLNRRPESLRMSRFSFTGSEFM